jgi:hypothetical protein
LFFISGRPEILPAIEQYLQSKSYYYNHITSLSCYVSTNLQQLTRHHVCHRSHLLPPLFLTQGLCALEMFLWRRLRGQQPLLSGSQFEYVNRPGRDAFFGCLFLASLGLSILGGTLAVVNRDPSFDLLNRDSFLNDAANCPLRQLGSSGAAALPASRAQHGHRGDDVDPSYFLQSAGVLLAASLAAALLVSGAFILLVKHSARALVLITVALQVGAPAPPRDRLAAQLAAAACPGGQLYPAPTAGPCPVAASSSRRPWPGSARWARTAARPAARPRASCPARIRCADIASAPSPSPPPLLPPPPQVGIPLAASLAAFGAGNASGGATLLLAAAALALFFACWRRQLELVERLLALAARALHDNPALVPFTLAMKALLLATSSLLSAAVFFSLLNGKVGARRCSSTACLDPHPTRAHAHVCHRRALQPPSALP